MANPIFFVNIIKFTSEQRSRFANVFTLRNVNLKMVFLHIFNNFVTHVG